MTRESWPVESEQSARILIVDDDRINRSVLEVMLSPEGFQLQFAASGDEALAIIVDQPPDLILLDVMMPGMNGHVLAGEIKRNFATRNIPIIMVTALDSHDAKLAGLLSGAEEFLTKPVDRAELRLRVRNLLRLKAYGERADRYSHVLELEVAARTSDVLERSKNLQDALASIQQAHVEQLALAERLRLETETRERLEFDLRRAQKLEALGLLASGVAHEINTPIQFISDSTTFVHEAVAELVPIVRKYQDLRRATIAGDPVQILLRELEGLEEGADLEYALENIPRALARARDGIERVAAIARSLKDFAHVDRVNMSPVDINQAVATTLIIAKHEYKLVADVETSFAELPPVLCHPGEINQVILNLLVNAAHAIEAAVAPSGGRGLIKLATTLDGDDVVISIADTGGGIPLDVQPRIFEPFFTTKAVGKGTGQGLAISLPMVERHGGTLTFQSQVGTGTTFRIRLPIQPRSAAASTPDA